MPCASLPIGIVAGAAFGAYVIIRRFGRIDDAAPGLVARGSILRGIIADRVLARAARGGLELRRAAQRLGTARTGAHEQHADKHGQQRTEDQVGNGLRDREIEGAEGAGGAREGEAFVAAGLDYIPSQGNFVMVRFAAADFERSGVLVTAARRNLYSDAFNEAVFEKPGIVPVEED